MQVRVGCSGFLRVCPNPIALNWSPLSVLVVEARACSGARDELFADRAFDVMKLTRCCDGVQEGFQLRMAM